MLENRIQQKEYNQQMYLVKTKIFRFLFPFNRKLNFLIFCMKPNTWNEQQLGFAAWNIDCLSAKIMQISERTFTKGLNTFNKIHAEYK